MAKEKNARAKYGRAKPKSNRMPILLMVGGAIVLVIALIFALQQPQGTTDTSGGTPKLKADKELVDLGDQTLGNPVKVTFQLSNSGDGTVRFSKEPYVEVKEGCWPPTPAIGSMAIQPGYSTTLTLEFMMHGNMGGKHDFRVHLPTNDPATPDLVLTVLSNWK